MFRIAVTAYWITANIFLSYAATVHTRDGQLQSGNLGRIDSIGVQVAGKTYKWKDLIRVRLNPGPSARSGLSEVRTQIWRGNYSNFPDETALNPSSIDNVRRHYLTVRRLGNTPGAILFEGKLNVPRAGNYHFRLGSDDGANLFVGGKAVLSTSAEYSYRRATKSIRLEQGSHAFRLEYLNLASYAILELEWSGPGLPWTSLGAVTDLPLPQAPPAIPAAGALAWNGSYIAHPLESLNESRVRFVGNPAGVQLTTVNASAIFFHPLSLPMADRIRSGKVGREGVLLVGGDFQEGEISSIKDNVITLQTLLFGSRKYQGGSQAAAVFLQKPAKLKDQWIVRTQLGTEIRLTKLEWDGSTLVANRTPFRKLRLKSGEIHEISYVTEPNVLQRAWETWASMDAEHKRQTVAGQGNFDSVFKARSEAKVYLAQLDEKWRRLEKEHVAIQKEVKTILVGLNQQEVSVRKARADLAKSQSNYAVVDNWLKVNAHYFNPKLREAHELKVRRLTEVKAALESEKKISLATEKRNTEILSKFQAERARQQEQYEKNAKDRNSDYTKVRVLFKGDYRPVEVTGAASRDRKVREYSESRRNRVRDLLNQYTPARDDARRRRDEAKRRVDAALVQYNARKKQFEQSVAQEAEVLRARLKPVEKKVLDLRAEHSVKATFYHELIGKESAVDQSRLDSISDLQSVDRHLRDWEGQLRSSQGKLRQAEQKKNNALRDHVRRRDLLEAARSTLYEFVDKHELPALQKLNATKVRHDKLVQAVKDNPGQGAWVARLNDEQAKMASDLAALTALRGKLNGLIGQFQSKLHDFANHQATSGRMEEEWKQTQKDIRLLEKFLSSKKARQAELRNITGNLTRQRTDRLNKTRQAKGEMDRALNALNQALGEHSRRIGEYGATISKKYEAARHLEDSENTLKREQHHLLQGETLVKLREKEWKRREQIFKQAEAAYVKADRVFKQSEAAKAALRKPLDGDQGKLLGSLEGWLYARQHVAHYKQETVIELEKMKGEMAVEYLPWATSITAREVELKRAEAGGKTAADARAQNEKEKKTLTQALKDAEAADKVKQSLQAESIKAVGDASNRLRDARSRAGNKQREWLEAVFQHERYRVQKRVVLGFE